MGEAINRAARAAFAAFMLLGCGLAPARANDQLKITVSGLVTGFANYFVAIDRGYFAQEGIDLDVIQAGGNVGTPALLSGDVFFSTSASIGLTAILKGGVSGSFMSTTITSPMSFGRQIPRSRPSPT